MRRGELSDANLQAVADARRELEELGFRVREVDDVHPEEGGVEFDLTVWGPTDYKPLEEEDAE